MSRRTGCREHAADLAQETFVRLLNARRQQTLQQPRAYLSSIARSLMIDQYRRRELERAYLESLAHFPQVEVPSEETRLLILDSLERIDRLLDQLKPRVREAFFAGATGWPDLRTDRPASRRVQGHGGTGPVQGAARVLPVALCRKLTRSWSTRRSSG
ncbi:sigma factor [Pseudomonas simiae]|nr:sigma factor [Pseudomonas simiae]WLI03067.1 sigma factor [Pseudomonas simiae]